MSNEKNIYLGVYGIYIKNGLVLLIKKARGPYIGLYDLPGGKLEFEETVEQCLQRELVEETNSVVKHSAFFSVNEYRCRYIKDNEEKDFHHLGIYYIVVLDIQDLRTGADGQDSLGAEFVSVDSISIDNVAPIAYPMIKKYLDTISQI